MARGGQHRYRSTMWREGRSFGDEESERTQAEMELEHFLDEHREGALVRTGISCRHGQYPRLACSWSGMAVLLVLSQEGFQSLSNPGCVTPDRCCFVVASTPN
ncbi:unnamed protein product [Urochloa humidicola]